jgi:hypothetical protein
VDGVQFDFLGICPKVREKICNATTLAECDFTGIPPDIVDIVKLMIEDAGQYFYTKIAGFRSDLEEIAENLNSMDDKVATFNWAFYIAAVFGGLLALLNIIISYGVILAWRDKLTGNCWRTFIGGIRHWFVLPLFVFTVLICFIFSMVFVIGSIGMADMCVDSPDDRLVKLLNANEDLFATAIYKFALYYVGGCKEVDVPVDIQVQIGILLRLLTKVTDVVRRLESTDSITFEDVCGRDPVVFTTLARALGDEVCSVTQTLGDVQTYFSCDNWHPLYETTMYDAVCYEGNEGFKWIATAQFFIVLFALIMLTLRVGFVEIEEEDNAVRGCRRWWASCYNLCACRRSQKDVPGDDDGKIFVEGDGEGVFVERDGEDVFVERDGEGVM